MRIEEHAAKMDEKWRRFSKDYPGDNIYDPDTMAARVKDGLADAYAGVMRSRLRGGTEMLALIGMVYELVEREGTGE